MTFPISIPFTDPRWASHPAPAVAPQIKDDELVVATDNGTGWWRTLEQDLADGSVYGFEVDLTKGVTISVELDIAHKDRPLALLAGSSDRSDQACLFMQIGERAWAKAGIEYDGQLLSGGVVTQPYSDWSVHPHPGGPRRYTITLYDRVLKIFEEGVMIRAVNAFGGGEETKALVGVMACSPMGGGVKATFKDFRMKLGPE